MKDFIKNFFDSTAINKWSAQIKKYDSKIFYKHYLRFDKVLLPNISKKTSTQKTLESRRSRKNFRDEKLDLADLGQIISSSCGNNYFDKKINEFLRFYPSAGARYPLETYLIASKVNGLKDRVYHYNVKFNHLESLDKELIFSLKKIFNQKGIETAPAHIVITAQPNRTTGKYGTRGLRYIFIEAGHLAQNIYLNSQSLGIKCCSVGAFHDDHLNKTLHINPEYESAIYVLALGK